ncbi:sulfatase-like hydrolase/transferase [Paenibacillus lautus]|uniref:sulfatase-like hydrolase/transferase n=1 Tax=Paenibacillus lautus TaxID=1401 RepID=UPI000FD881B6|nr:sulfatase-like hydrolase/transferase [Paenibacillus lautus]
MKILKISTSVIILFIIFSLLCPVTKAESDYLGSIDSPTSNAKVSDTLSISGWVFNKKAEITSVTIYVDGNQISKAQYGLERKDVETTYPQYKQAATSGFLKDISIADFSFDKHVLDVIAESTEGDKYSVARLNIIREQKVTFTIDSTVKDVIKNEEDISINGWAFNETGIRSIEVYFNDEYIGNANYGIERKDVHSSYPNDSNSNYSGFNFIHKSKKLDPGDYKLQLIAVTNNGEKSKFYEDTFIKQDDNIVVRSIIIILLFCLLTLLLFKNHKKNKQFIKLKFLFDHIIVLWFIISTMVKTLLFSHFSNTSINIANVFCTLGLTTVIALMISFLKHYHLRNIIYILINVLLTIIILADLIYIRYFNDVTSIIMLQYIQQVSQLGDSIFQLLKPADTIFFVDYIFVLFLFVLLRNNRPGKMNKLIIVSSISLSLFAISLQVVKIYKDDTQIFKQTFSNREVVNHLGIINYHAFDIYKYLESSLSKPKVNSEEKMQIQNWFDNHNIYYPESPTFGKFKNKNLILIQVESLQSFVVNLNVNGYEVTPNLNKLAREGFYFNNFFDQTYNGRTSDGELTALASLYPLREGTVNFRYPNTELDTLPKLLKDSGYATFSAHAYNGEFWNRKPMHHNYGFEESYFAEDFNTTESIGWGLSDTEFFVQSIEKIRDLKRPFFSFLITLTNHHPYDSIPEKYKELDLSGIDDRLMENYLHSVHYTDTAIGVLIEKLKQEELYNDTIIAIYGDHDAGLETKSIWQMSDTNLNYNKFADKVPFIIHIPGTNDSNEDGLAGHLDIAPTLLHLLGIDTSEAYFMGGNLFEHAANRILPTRDGSYITDEFLFEGPCINLTSGTQIDTKYCNPPLEDMATLFRISDIMIKTDLFSKREIEKH